MFPNGGFENYEYSCFLADIYIDLQVMFQKTIMQPFMIIKKFKVWTSFDSFICSDFTHLKINKRTVPNKKVRSGKNLEINKRTAYVYLDP